MAAVIRLLAVFAFFALIAVLGLNSSIPKPLVGIGVASVISLVLLGKLASYQKQRDLDAMQILMRNLHRPNEAVAVDVLKYAQWGLVAVAVVGIGSGVLTHAGPINLLGFGVLLPIAFGIGHLGKMIRAGADDWLSTRLRLTGVTHRSVEFVLLANANASSGPIQVQVEYSRHLPSAGDHSKSWSELIWRSPSITMEPVRLADRTEFRAQIAMPHDFPQPLAVDTGAWYRRWNIKIQPSPQRTLNFDFRVPATTAPDA